MSPWVAIRFAADSSRSCRSRSPSPRALFCRRVGTSAALMPAEPTPATDGRSILPRHSTFATRNRRPGPPISCRKRGMTVENGSDPSELVRRGRWHVVCRAWIARRDSARLDVDALAGAFLGGFDHGFELVVGDLGETLGALGVALGLGEDLAALDHVGETVVEQGEDVGCDLLAQAVAGAQILIDPDLHVSGSSSL